MWIGVATHIIGASNGRKEKRRETRGAAPGPRPPGVLRCRAGFCAAARAFVAARGRPGAAPEPPRSREIFMIFVPVDEFLAFFAIRLITFCHLPFAIFHLPFAIFHICHLPSSFQNRFVLTFCLFSSCPGPTSGKKPAQTPPAGEAAPSRVRAHQPRGAPDDPAPHRTTPTQPRIPLTAPTHAAWVPHGTEQRLSSAGCSDPSSAPPRGSRRGRGGLAVGRCIISNR